MNDESALIPSQVSALPAMQGPWLVFAPHPDDESFGMGGTLALAAQAGLAVHVVVVTDGALGGSGADLVQVRKQEALAAAALLGIASVQFLDEPDRALVLTEALVARIVRVLETLRPTAVFFPGVFEYHPDHRTCALLVWEALRRHGNAAVEALAYEITAQSPVNVLVDISTTMPLKRQAIAAYRSQLSDKNYGDIVAAFNRVRSLSLGPQVQSAEGFYRYSPDERRGSLEDWLLRRTRQALAQRGH